MEAIRILKIAERSCFTKKLIERHDTIVEGLLTIKGEIKNNNKYMFDDLFYQYSKPRSMFSKLLVATQPLPNTFMVFASTFIAISPSLTA